MKTVLFSIKVPEGKYCHGREDPLDNFACCEHLDSTGGHMTCDYRMRPLEQDETGCLKPQECLKLMTVEEHHRKWHTAWMNS